MYSKTAHSNGVLFMPPHICLRGITGCWMLFELWFESLHENDLCLMPCDAYTTEFSERCCRICPGFCFSTDALFPFCFFHLIHTLSFPSFVFHPSVFVCSSSFPSILLSIRVLASSSSCFHTFSLSGGCFGPCDLWPPVSERVRVIRGRSRKWKWRGRVR